MTHVSLAAAAVLTIAVGLAHSILGEQRLIGPLLDPDRRQGLLAKNQFSRGVLRFAWHLTTLAWWGFAAIFAVLSTVPLAGHDSIILAVSAIMFGLTGLIALITSRGRHLSWPVFLAIAGLLVAPLL
jgi:hypothetical protein